MSVRKYVKYAAPYRSKTFNDTHSKMTGVNGVLTGGAVSSSGPTVTIQPITFVQNGGIVEVDAALTGTVPASITAPYFVAVTVSTMIENLSEVITPTFVKRPQDVSANTVLVAEYDGFEWRAMPKLQLDELRLADQTALLDHGLTGIASGMATTSDVSTITVASGTVVSTDGIRSAKALPTTFTKLASDADGYDRVDQIVFRKPVDSRARVGSLEYVCGPVFDPSGATVFGSVNAIGNGVDTVSTPKILNNPANNETYYVFIQGTDLILRTAPDNLSSFSSSVVIAATVDEFDAVYNSLGSIDLFYRRSMGVYHKRITTSGSALIAESQVYINFNALANPRVAMVKQDGGFYLHMVWEREISVTERHLMYARVSQTGTLDTTAQLLVNLSATLRNPSLAADHDDTLLLLAFENADTGRAYLRTYDASTATALSVPTQIGYPVELQDDTYNLSTMSIMPTTGAQNPVVVRAANKETFVFWRHFKGSGNYGIAVYSSSNYSKYGHKAVIKDLYTALENISKFDVAVDGLNNAYFFLNTVSQGWKSQLRLKDMSVVGSAAQITTNNPDGVRVIFTSRGALIHGWAVSVPQLRVRKSTASVVETMRAPVLPSSDVSVAQYRTSDGFVSSTDTSVNEIPALKRLYTQANTYAATGTISWRKAGPNQLVLEAPLVLRCLDRLATYTVPANDPGGITVLPDQVCYVSLPDDDTTQNLTLEVKDFGDGSLDRNGKFIYSLFWNIGGVLYTRFAPFRLDSDGESINLGDTISQEMMQWLGVTDSSPDPSNHGYITTNVLVQSDDVNTALGKLDQAFGTIFNDTPKEEQFVVGGGGQSIFTATLFNWNPANTSVDIVVYVNGIKAEQSLTGALDKDFRKNSSTVIEFAYTVPENAKVTIRDERTGGSGSGAGVTNGANVGTGTGNVFKINNAGTLQFRRILAGSGISVTTSGDDVVISATGGAAEAYFVNYLTGQTAYSIGTGAKYNLGTDKLKVYRNGLVMLNTASVGSNLERYQELTNKSVLLSDVAVASDLFAFVNQDVDVDYSTIITGITGVTVTVPTYVMGNNALRVYRNGVLMNAASLGTAVDQYTEASTTSLSLNVAAVSTDVFLVERGPVPTFREDLDGFSGTLITLGSSYTMGTQELLVFRNGILLYNSLTLGAAINRYQETSTTTVTVGVTASPSDVFTFIKK